MPTINRSLNTAFYLSTSGYITSVSISASGAGAGHTVSFALIGTAYSGTAIADSLGNASISLNNSNPPSTSSLTQLRFVASDDDTLESLTSGSGSLTYTEITASVEISGSSTIAVNYNTSASALLAFYSTNPSDSSKYLYKDGVLITTVTVTGTYTIIATRSGYNDGYKTITVSVKPTITRELGNSFYCSTLSPLTLYSIYPQLTISGGGASPTKSWKVAVSGGTLTTVTSYTFDTPGSYIGTLVVTNAGIDSDTYNFYVTVGAAEVEVTGTYTGKTNFDINDTDLFSIFFTEMELDPSYPLLSQYVFAYYADGNLVNALSKITTLGEGVHSIVVNFETTNATARYYGSTTVPISIGAGTNVLKKTRDAATAYQYELAKDYSCPTFYYLDEDSNDSSAGIWRPVKYLLDPISASYSYDETMDQINLTFIDKLLINKFKKYLKIMVVYDSPSPDRSLWGVPTYDSNGKPTNHDVMVIEDGDFNSNFISHFKIHSYHALELIQLTANVKLENLAFSSATQVTISISNRPGATQTTYYHAPQTAWSILNKALRNCGWDSKLKIDEETQAFLMQQLYNVDDTLKDSTLADFLYALGRKIDRTPVIYLNKDYGTVDAYEYLLFFENKNDNGNTPISFSELYANHIEHHEKLIAGKGQEKIVCDAYNVATTKPSYWPGENMYGLAVSENVENLTIEPSGDESPKMVIRLNDPISSLIALKAVRITKEYYTESHDILYSQPSYSNIVCLEKKDWLVDEDREDKAYFEENGNEIHFGANIETNIYGYNYDELHHPANPDPVELERDEYSRYMFNVEYNSTPVMKIEIGNGNYEASFNQLEQIQDSEALGIQLEAYQKSNSGDDILITKIVTGYYSIRMPGTKVVMPSGEIYVITSTSFGNTPCITKTKYAVTYQLNKFARRNRNVKASEEIRNYQIPTDNIIERLINISDTAYLHLTSDETTTIANGTKYVADKKILLGGFVYDKTIETMVINGKSFNYKTSALSDDEKDDIDVYIQLTPNKTLCANSILIAASFADNVYAGYKILQTRNETEVAIKNEQRGVYYVDAFGELKMISIGLSYLANESEQLFNFANQYPELSNSEYGSYFVNSLVKITDKWIDKDSREKLSLTYQLNYEGINNSKISNDITAYSGLYGKNAYVADLRFVALYQTKMYDIDEIISSSDCSIIKSFNFITQGTNGEIVFNLSGYSLTPQASVQYALVKVIAGDSYKIIALMGDRVNGVATTKIYLHVN